MHVCEAKLEDFQSNNQGSRSALQRDLERKEAAIEEYSRETRKQQAAARRLRCTAEYPQLITFFNSKT